jgi:hypothetical protein
MDRSRQLKVPSGLTQVFILRYQVVTPPAHACVVMELRQWLSSTPPCRQVTAVTAGMPLARQKRVSVPPG